MNTILINNYLNKISTIFLAKKEEDVVYKHTYTVQETDQKQGLFKGDLVSYYTVKDEESKLLLECKYAHPKSLWNKIISIYITKFGVPTEDGRTKDFVIEIQIPFSLPELKVSHLVHPFQLQEVNTCLQDLIEHLSELFKKDLTKRVDNAWDEALKNIELSLSQIKSDGEEKQE